MYIYICLHHIPTILVELIMKYSSRCPSSIGQGQTCNSADLEGRGIFLRRISNASFRLCILLLSLCVASNRLVEVIGSNH